MYKKISTGKITVGEKLLVKLMTKEIIGDIEKVKIICPEDCGLINISMSTSDGENFLDVEIKDTSIFYPRNWSVSTQKYTNVNVANDQSNVLRADRYLSYGNILIEILGKIEGDSIDNIELIYKTEQPLEFVNKEEAVTSDTEGVYNPVHDPRRKDIKEYLNKTFMNIAKEETEHNKSLVIDVNKAQDRMDSIIDIIAKALYHKKFKGIDKKTSDQIKNYIVKALREGKTLSQVMKYIRSKGIDEQQAENIARTESHAVQTTVREWSYKQTDPDGEFLYKWIGPDDFRTSKLCTTIKSRTQNGVKLDELKNIIEEESKKELGDSWEVRGFNPHINCRHNFIRYFD